MRNRFVVKLSKKQRGQLMKAFRGGKASVLELRRMRILLMADINGPGLSDEKIAEALCCSPQTALNVRRNFVHRGFQGAISRKEQERPSNPPILDGEKEARIITLACSAAPEGTSRWTLRLLAERAVELEIVDHLSHETIRSVLKKANLSLI